MKEGWEYKKLDDICTIVGRIGFRGYTKADLVNSSKDGAITLSPSNIINGELDYSKCTYINWDKYFESPEIMLENGDIVLVKTASIGKCAVVKKLPHEATLNPQFVVLKQLSGVSDFICYYLKSSIAQNTIKQMAGGVAIPTLSQKKLGMMIVPAPSLSEQQSIVDYLDSAFAKIDAMKANAEKSLNEAKALFQASLKKMLEPKEGWEEKTLKEITSKIGDGLHGTPKYSDDGNYFFVNGNNFENGLIEIKDNTKRIGLEEYEKYKIDLNTSTVLLSINGTIGKTAFYDGEPIILGKSACYINVLPALLKEYLRYFLLSDFFVIYAKKNARQATIVNLGLKELRNMPIPLPPLSEQQSIVATLDSLKSKVDRLQENYNKISQECDALKQALLREVFEG